MITEQVSQEQLAAWRALCREKRPLLHPNRISGAALDDYFRAHYEAVPAEVPAFREAVYQNAAVQDPNLSPAHVDICTYMLDGGVYVGIERVTGFFQVECEDMALAVPVWDALFAARGLSEQDLDNYVLTAQYLLLTGAEGVHKEKV